jgi:hypothetical protein
MNSNSPFHETSGMPETDGDEVTGLPALRTWPRVYLFVLVVFIVYVVLLTALTRGFA